MRRQRRRHPDLGDGAGRAGRGGAAAGERAVRLPDRRAVRAGRVGPDRRPRPQRPIRRRGATTSVTSTPSRASPDEQAFWFDQHPDLLLPIDGEPLIDPGWPDEYLFDLTTAAKRAGGRRPSSAAGSTAARPTGSRPSSRTTSTPTPARRATTDSRAGAGVRRAADHAPPTPTASRSARRTRGDLGAPGRAAGFDFAVAEECQVYEECGDYTDVYGDQVYEIEYTDNPESAFTDACSDHGAHRRSSCATARSSRAATPTTSTGHAEAMSALERFVEAQDARGTYEQRPGRTPRRAARPRTGCGSCSRSSRASGRSATAQRYAIASLDEARRTPPTPCSVPRLRQCATDAARPAARRDGRARVRGHRRGEAALVHDVVRARRPRRPGVPAVLGRYFAGEPDAATERLLGPAGTPR